MRSANTPKIQLLLNHADDHSPVLADGLPGAAIGAPAIPFLHSAPVRPAVGSGGQGCTWYTPVASGAVQ